MRNIPDLAALQLLVDVATHGSIGAAGRANGITQQSASERLRAVEALTGLTLLRRAAGGSTLTESGVLVVGWAARLIDLAQEIDESIATLREGRTHQLSIVASMTVAEYLLPLWLVRLRQQHDTVVSLIATNSEHVRTAVADGSADIGFVEDGADPGDLASLVVARDELGLYSAPHDPWAKQDSPLAPDEIVTRPLTWREAGSGSRRVVDDALARLGLTATAPAAELTTTSGIRSAVSAGSPPAFMSRRSVRSDVEAGRLVEVPIIGLDLSRDLTALWVGSGRPPAGPVRDLLAIATKARTR
ncbi:MULTISPECIES: LysR family transcriptional regulator [Aeromicrobium]|jgi:molybdate transport repressor ModE-like protein|uniref:LysR family transcriptional regulator n=1 Tax=Aeromicrobium fastidiosum TaxID=52699 RepID=A0A641ALK7_9ACTN|nr:MULTISPECIES: LysR family transcriptional regulator [Aeromicrobium]KAA1378170.1 LysR family transcriptional regulator [Aeromicrobium fastidiosum]KQX72343.1 LysR family transcriptional regulator [Aeromicrobium sp. Root472D3]MBD8607932.1 LysR family transcriptional regulator [Aeromicrobium sp. CFBP 8757]MBP2389023.1 molybdate transport repressor ModE-like protein [Aeromicrobium fastidiosum]